MSNINFDWETYLDNYADLRNAGINTQELALQHWNDFGKNEDRTDKDINFDWETYLDNYEDLRNAGINTQELALHHWYNYGKNEGRTDKDINFDWETYLDNYEDLRNAGINTQELVLHHWYNYGKNEGRTDKDINFDWETYLDNYEDLRNAGINSKELAIQHWNDFGKNEGRINKIINNDYDYDFDFDSKGYLDNYKDLVDVGINTYESALQHWKNHGKHEGRISIKFSDFISKKDYNIILDEYHQFYYPQHNFNKTLILYVFNEYNDIVNNFIKNCIFKHDNYDFLIIINNINFNISILNLPEYVKYIIRDNIGFDFGGWSDGLLINDLYKNYDSFIFINSSVYGPCMEKSDTRLWTDILLNGLNYNNIKLFGTIINCSNIKKINVQSMVFCMDLLTLEYLILKNIFSIKKYTSTFVETVNDRETRMSREIINNNWNIGCLHTYYKGIDFTFKNKNREIKYLNDLCHYNSFFGKTLHPYEILFVKGNRNIDPNFIKKYINYTNS